jgi:hypothetical protein
MNSLHAAIMCILVSKKTNLPENPRTIEARFRGRPLNLTVVQLNVPTSCNLEEEIIQLFVDPED